MQRSKWNIFLILTPERTHPAKNRTLSIFARFDGLNEEQDYTVSISTELDGKTITQVNGVQNPVLEITLNIKL